MKWNKNRYIESIKGSNKTNKPEKQKLRNSSKNKGIEMISHWNY